MEYSCASNFNTNSVALQRGCLQKKLIKLVACSAEVFLADSLLYGEKGARHTNTPNYCNPAAHARRRVNKVCSECELISRVLCDLVAEVLVRGCIVEV